MGDQIIRWGVIAGALAAIIGLGVLVWDLAHPDDAKIDARFEQLDVERGVTFGDFEGGLELGALPRDTGVALAKELVAQDPVDPQDPSPSPSRRPRARPTVPPSAPPRRPRARSHQARRLIPLQRGSP